MILDTFQDFLDFWDIARTKPAAEQVRLWESSYMGGYPELLAKQVKSYEDDGEAWQNIAINIIPQYQTRLPLMKVSRDNILSMGEFAIEKAREKLDIDFNIDFVIYIGIGCGAGWATEYDGRPAVLFGLENIAEERWHTKNHVNGLLSHELGHLVHMEWRGGWGDREKDMYPFFLLYIEGFAQRCEHLIQGKNTWHMASDSGWISWCEENRSWLKNEYLERIWNGRPVRDFFGSWIDIQGWKQTGYYLGHDFIGYLERSYSLKQIAVLPYEEVRAQVLEWLNE